MNISFLKRLISLPQTPLPYSVGLLVAGLLLGSGQPTHATAVNVLGGGAASPYKGYVNGNTFNAARFDNPQGIALDPSGTRLLVADYTNNAIRLIYYLGDNTASQTYSVYTNKDGITRPVAVLVDAQTNIYVLNGGTNGNGGNLLKFNGHYLLEFDRYKSLISSNSYRFTNATAMTMDGLTNLYITCQSNRVLCVNPAGLVTTVGVITNAGTHLRGVCVLENGNLALTDAGNHGIWTMNPHTANPTNNATHFTGFNGAGDTTGTPAFATFNRPEQIAMAGNGVLVVADRLNHKVKWIDPSGNVKRLYGVSSNYWGNVVVVPPQQGKIDGTVNPLENLDLVQAREPFGIAVGSDGSVYATEAYYHVLRKASSTGLTGPGALGTPPLLNSPAGIALNNSSDTLFIADPTNNVVYRLNLGDNTTTTFLTSADGIYQPVDVAVDTANNLYVLNQGAGSTNGSVYIYDEFGNFLENYVGGLTLPTALSFDAQDKLFIASLGGKLQSFTGSSSNTIVTISTNANVKLQGVAVFDNGKIAVSDAGNHVLWLVDPATQTYARLSGAVGTVGTAFGTSAQTRLNTPQRIAFADGNKLVVADSGNDRLVVVQSSGAITNSLISTNGTLWFGRNSDPVSTSSALYVAMKSPVGVALGGGGTVYASEAAYKDIRAMGNTGILPPPGPPAPPSAPTIGWVDFVDVGSSYFVSKLVPVVSQTFNNDVILAILPATNGIKTYYSYGAANVPDPTTNNTTPEIYQDGWFATSVKDLGITRYPTTIIRAASVDSYGSSSAITLATFQFVTANPLILGNNAAQFTVSTITTNAEMYYTIDGSDPTNVAVGSSVGPIKNGALLSLNIVTNTTFKIRAYRRPNYQDSGIVTAEFSASNFVANTLSFGFGAGEASSDFVASPGQTFYAPVTLALLPNVKMYSLQFNITATNAGAGPAVLPDSFNFKTMLKKPHPDFPGVFIPIYPYGYAAAGGDPQPNSSSFLYQGDWYENLLNINTGNNLLTVGWLERYSATNLYNTKSQDLITYSQAHDVLYSSAAGNVEVGGYSLFIPGTAAPGQIYRIQIGRASATADGVGAPGSDVFIATPTNGSYGAGLPINAVKNITVGQRKYVAGDVYPFRWFNAGDFGNTNLNNVDVMQVFQSAIYGLNTPPIGSDFFDGMDSSGFTYVNNGNGYLEINAAASPATLFDGNDTTINQIAFGDGNLDVTDVYVTYRRSLDPSLTWFRRFWTNSVRVAETIPNVTPFVVSKTLTAKTITPKAATASAITPQINVFAGDIQGTAGQTVQIPITAKILGSYPARVLMLNLTVQPLDGSPALTTSVQFTPTNALGAPSQSGSMGNGNYSAAWLNSAIAGLSSNAYIGTLSLTIPANATSASAYAIHFDHASASPNGLASFPKQTLTGLVTLAARTNSVYGDAIPDSWRLRWFGTANNYLSTSNACPSGDGVSNWKKFVAGIDPNVANNFPSVNPKAKANTGYTATIHWPTVSGKQYLIERSADLFAGWSTISTNTGTGGDLEFNDANTSKVKFYRVRILP